MFLSKLNGNSHFPKLLHKASVYTKTLFNTILYVFKTVLIMLFSEDPLCMEKMTLST